MKLRKKIKLMVLVTAPVYAAFWVALSVVTSIQANPSKAALPDLEVAAEQDSGAADTDTESETVQQNPVEFKPIPQETAAEAPTTAPEVPPDDPPDTIAIEEEIQITRCFDATGFPRDNARCGTLSNLTETLTERLYVAEKCRAATLGEHPGGLLELGMELDFQRGSLSFWSTPNSRIPKTDELVSCLNTELEGFPLKDLAPRFARYHLLLALRFGRPGATSAVSTGTVSPSEPVDMNQGRIVSVIKDRVRVRKKPIDGEIMGKISSGNRVLLLAEAEGWCYVKTPRGNVGWMVCWALER